MAEGNGWGRPSLPNVVIADNLVRRQILSRVFGLHPAVFKVTPQDPAPAAAHDSSTAIPTTMQEALAALGSIPRHITSCPARMQALRRVLAIYVPLFQVAFLSSALSLLFVCLFVEFSALAGVRIDEAQLRQTVNGIGVFAGSAFRQQPDKPVSFLNGLLSQRIDERLYEALTRHQSDFTVVQLPARRKSFKPVYRVCVGPLALLNAGCRKHARVLCRAREEDSVWRVAQLLHVEISAGQEFLSRYSDSAAKWTCPEPACGVRL